MKVQHLLWFTIAITLCGTLLLMAFPEDGLPIGANQRIYLPSLHDILSTSSSETEGAKEIAALLDEEIAPDTIVVDPKVQARLDSIKKIRMQDSLRKWQLQLHYPNKDKKALYPFFKALRNASSKPIRILHYGDSQMEGDRITGYLRSKLQSQFGGSGPGLLATIPLCPTPLANYTYSENWERFKGFGYRDKRIKHTDYGPMICFAKINTESADSTSTDSVFTSELMLEKSNLGGHNLKDWRHFEMLYNHAQDPFLFELYEDTTRVFIDYLFSEEIKTFEWDIKNTALTSLKIRITCKSSPEIVGFSIEGKKGVWVDNIALRGSAGSIFNRVGRNSLVHFYDQHHIPLIILQFGGNNMPYMEDKAECERYGKLMKKNMEYLKSLIPGVSLIVIGPSDMSYKEGTEWKTYPLLKSCRDELKKATFAAGGVYWDLFEAMGGENSMPLWVEKDLAASDHIHFTRGGARKAASWFYDILLHDYEEYTKKSK